LPSENIRRSENRSRRDV